MIFSEQWLSELVDHKLETQQLIDELTMAGLEVDGSSAVAREFSGIIVGVVNKVEPHPDADKLNVCQVSDGKDLFQVVCGAPNVREGMKVPFAIIGAEILPVSSKPDGDEKPFKIKKAKLRGVESNGMLCSAEELGLEESSEGLFELSENAPVGEDVRTYLQLDDISIELDLTPNRGDCLGMKGLAREVGVITRQDVSYPEAQAAPQSISDEFPIGITAASECPRYLGRVIKNINLNSESPLWMQEKLRRSGLRSIDPIVDVTNYVLMELGQPMHAFDFAKLEGHIDVRLANKNEKLTLLDGKEVELTPDTLVIADSKKAVAMAGIMGGLDTSVTDETSDVFLECAFFSQLAIAGKARAYGMHTDASHRYERGVDYSLQHEAIERGTQLLLEIVGGEAGPITEATGKLPTAAQVRLNYCSIKRFLGVEMGSAEVVDILTRLGFETESKDDDGIVVNVPSFRFDVAIEADLIEEIARIYGYNNIPQEGGLTKQQLKSKPEAELGISRIRQHLVALGYQEVITYSFIDPEIAAISCPGETLIELQNPISAEMSVMRPSILPGLLSCLKYNENRQQDRIRLFESGLVFQSIDGEIRQQGRLAGLISGSKNPLNWNTNKDLSDFYDVKGDIESLFDLSGEGLSYSFSSAQFGCFHSGQCARVEKGGELVGYIGALHPAIQRKLGITENTYLFELALDQLNIKSIPVASKLSKYPEVSRDLAFVLDISTTSAQILDNVRANAGEYLSDLRIFDVYQGDAVAKDKKSIALGLTWQHPSRTLSDDDINAIISTCVNGLQDDFNANLRN
ncbi:MAG: phenylalanine--tRNA ligase subunit beta [Gammaproteobacteria bacterium]|jgi:phenylalanyl-tRNA synthetase beta chain|nr:phenylalanine--tRNA ligase subunit beta [Gammaproteobacteria bacterium]MBT3859508.1 phenylalanine--tRNA ligase subunit beta [Gammaproteobacteria bacterium]MBT3986598.1 phenylalanine--tRNA ligase subunit beta [Gammaproteobacteria bacterium]MBT4254795.1 phenylalanine--tRNA ligase subunit beta [Gammaproteobacteria bacterium]MBT4581058.1 phenylalanine--tRNA ligase subunit beta [Gammaproteobacteria bacterium]